MGSFGTDYAAKLFLDTLSDIENSLTSNDPYKVLIISGLIRKLFLDDFPLFDQVNRHYHTKLSFDIFPPNDALIEKAEYYIQADGLDPNTAARPRRLQSITRDQFFKTTVLAIRGKRYTIKDLVLFEANIMGGIHAGTSKTIKEQALQKINSIYEIGDSRGSLLQIKAISRVTLKALEPLRDCIMKNNFRK